jgi:hypothetical protein
LQRSIIIPNGPGARAHLADLLDQAGADLPGRGLITIADQDGDLAWTVTVVSALKRGRSHSLMAAM